MFWSRLQRYETIRVIDFIYGKLRRNKGRVKLTGLGGDTGLSTKHDRILLVMMTPNLVDLGDNSNLKKLLY